MSTPSAAPEASQTSAGEKPKKSAHRSKREEDPEVPSAQPSAQDDDAKRRSARRSKREPSSVSTTSPTPTATDQQRALEASIVAQAPRLAEPETETELTSLESIKVDDSELLAPPFPLPVCDSFNRLQRHARELNMAVPVPEIVLVGPRGHGKSALVEAVLGACINFVGGSGSRRPIIFNVVSSQQGARARCVVKRDGVVREFDKDVEVKVGEVGAEIARRNEAGGACETCEPIVVHFESSSLVSMTVIDTPGLIVDPSDPQSKVREQLALKAIAPSNRLVVVVRQSSDAALPVVSSSDYVLDVVRQVDPEFTRTVLVYTHLHQQLQLFQSTKAANKFLAGTVPDVRTFFATLPAAAIRESLISSPAEAFALKLVQAERRDLALLEQLQYDRKYQPAVGCLAVVRHVAGFVWRNYQESAPRMVRVLRQRRADVLKALEVLAAQDEGLTPAFLRTCASRYASHFVRAAHKLLRGTAEGDPAVNGQTLEQERTQCGVDAQWADSRGVPLAALLSGDAEEWAVPRCQNKLYGGQQFERLLAEFQAVCDHTQLDDSLSCCSPSPAAGADLLATASGVPRLGNLPSQVWAACDVAAAKLRESFEPLVGQLSERASFVMKRLTDIAEPMAASSEAAQEQQKGNKPTGGIAVGSTELYPFYRHWVKEQFNQFVDDAVARAREACSGEFYSARTVYWEACSELAADPQQDGAPSGTKLAKTLFNRLKDRLARNVVLKFYNYLVVPVEVSLGETLHQAVCSLGDKALEDLFEPSAVKERIAATSAKLKAGLEGYEEKEKLLMEAATSFAHP